MFIRWNASSQFWEYDSSGGVGAGPWIILPNIPYLNRNNIFTAIQELKFSGARINFNDTGAAVDSRNFNIQAFNGDLYFQARTDADVYQRNAFRIKRDGSLFERERTTAIGEWINVPYSAANFSASGSMTWTVDSSDQVTYAYTLIGKTLIFSFLINSTTVGGTTDLYLQVKIPGGYLPSLNLEISTWLNDANTMRHGRIRVFAGDPWLRIMRLDGINWTAGLNATGTYGQVMMPIQ
jgi:hypothetical protein